MTRDRLRMLLAVLLPDGSFLSGRWRRGAGPPRGPQRAGRDSVAKRGDTATVRRNEPCLRDAPLTRAARIGRAWHVLRLPNLLPFWFLGWDALRLYQVGLVQRGLDFSSFGRDFRIYRNAALELAAGRDPFGAFAPWNGVDWHFAAPPIAAQAFVPFALVPEWLGLATFAALSIAVLCFALRRLGLPLWWILFPPVVEGLVAMNPQILVVGLLVVGTSRTSVVAAWLKVFAVIPMVARRQFRAVAILAASLVVSVAVSPGAWREYVARYGEISGRLMAESQGGVSATLFLNPRVLPLGAGLLVVGIVALLVLLVAARDVRSAGWLAVPLLWPAAEYHYATFAMPVARRISTWILAVPLVPTYLVGLLVLAYEIVAERRPLARQERPMGLTEWLRTLPIGRRRPRGS